MTDDEIKTKRLTDWKPETDIKLQKAFGKFVEEVGELQVEIGIFHSRAFACRPERHGDIENEIADSLAFSKIIALAAGDRLPFSDSRYDTSLGYLNRTCKFETDVLLALAESAGRALSIVGRCQIQGLTKADPENGTSNALTLSYYLAEFAAALDFTITKFSFNGERIANRASAKIESKLPWVMGTATDLLPDL